MLDEATSQAAHGAKDISAGTLHLCLSCFFGGRLELISQRLYRRSLFWLLGLPETKTKLPARCTLRGIRRRARRHRGAAPIRSS